MEINLMHSWFVIAFFILGSEIFEVNSLHWLCNFDGSCDAGKLKCIGYNDTCLCFNLDDINICNGARNCDNSLDENLEMCGKKKCEDDQFQCYYGGCIHKSLYCTGIGNCADYSDEPKLCGNNLYKNASFIADTRKLNESSKCQQGQFRCRSGQCIDEDLTCDGYPHCNDKTDEHTFICENFQCTKREFQCKYGACVDKKSKCDGIRDCADGSDEDECNARNLCRLPTVDGVKYFDVDTNEVLFPGTLTNLHQTVLEDCDYGYYKTYPRSFRTCGKNGNWTSVTNELCLKMCPPLISDTLDIKCTFNSKNTNCSNLSIPETVATLSCKFLHYSKEDIQQNPRELLCQSNGTWNDQLYKCHPECGRGYIKNQVLIKNGIKTSVSITPWNVAVYELNKSIISNWDLICGGSLIAKNLVVSAAHCFWKSNMRPNMNATLKNVDQYKIAVGKYDRNITVIDSEFTRIINVDTIYMNVDYDGQRGNHAADIAVIVLKHKVDLSNGVASVCIDWKGQYHVSNGGVGKIVGWGITEKGVPSAVLLEASLPYIDRIQCRSLFLNDFHVFVTMDKFCAGLAMSNESSQTVQPGDSGSGLTFIHSNSYFLNGILSLRDPTANNSIAVFTDVNHHITWIRSLFDKHVET